jgi:hypothetical protein
MGYKSFHTKEMLQNADIMEMWFSNVFSKPQATPGKPDFILLVQHGVNALLTDLPTPAISLL